MSDVNEVQNEMEEVEVLTLEDEENNSAEFEVLDEIKYNGKDYIVLLPLEDEIGEEAEVLILEVENANTDNEEFVDIEDEAILDAVFAIFLDNMGEEE